MKFQCILSKDLRTQDFGSIEGQLDCQGYGATQAHCRVSLIILMLQLVISLPFEQLWLIGWSFQYFEIATYTNLASVYDIVT